MKNTPYLEAPHYLLGDEYAAKSLFLAGSITGAWNWQAVAGKALQPYFQIFNPRRDNFNTLDEGVERAQITWEYVHLLKASTILFWFSHETLAPITLFELGTVMEEGKTLAKDIFIGIDPAYQRGRDIIIQTSLRAPNLSRQIYDNLDRMLNAIIEEQTHAPRL